MATTLRLEAAGVVLAGSWDADGEAFLEIPGSSTYLTRDDVAALAMQCAALLTQHAPRTSVPAHTDAQGRRPGQLR